MININIKYVTLIPDIFNLMYFLFISPSNQPSSVDVNVEKPDVENTI